LLRGLIPRIPLSLHPGYGVGFGWWWNVARMEWNAIRGRGWPDWKDSPDSAGAASGLRCV